MQQAFAGSRPGGRAMTIRIRRGVATDAAALAELGGRLFRQTYEHATPAATLEEHVTAAFAIPRVESELADPDLVTLLVETPDAMVGYAQLRHSSIPEGSSGEAEVELWRIYLERSHHGSGLGRRLLEEVGQAAREMGARSVWLGVWEENPRAIAFYSKHGFEVVGRHSFYVADEAQRDLVMCVSADAL